MTFHQTIPHSHQTTKIPNSPPPYSGSSSSSSYHKWPPSVSVTSDIKPLQSNFNCHCHSGTPEGYEGQSQNENWLLVMIGLVFFRHASVFSTYPCKSVGKSVGPSHFRISNLWSVTVAQIKKVQKTKSIYFRILLLGGPSPPTKMYMKA